MKDKVAGDADKAKKNEDEIKRLEKEQQKLYNEYLEIAKAREEQEKKKR